MSVKNIFLPAPTTEPKHDFARIGSDTMHLFFPLLKCTAANVYKNLQKMQGLWKIRFDNNHSDSSSPVLFRYSVNFQFMLLFEKQNPDIRKNLQLNPIPIYTKF